MPLNPNFPVLDYAISWPNGPQQSCLQPYWCSLGQERSDATYGNGADATRGKQYELDQVQPGEMHLSLTNKDGAFDPANPASPYAGFVLPYRLFRMRAQWPPTDNLLTQNQATAGEATTSIGALSLAGLDQVEKPWAAGTTPPAWCVLQNAVSPTAVAASGTAWQGGQVFNHAVQPAATYPFNAVGMQGWSVAGGKAHAFTLHARAATGITASAAVAVQWLDASGAPISTSTGVPSALATGTSWTTLTLAATAPANAAAAIAYLAMQTGPAATGWTLQSDGWDVRKGTSTPAYITPGTWFPMFTGYVERWPQRWVAAGLYGLTDITIVDEFAVLSQRNLLAPFKADLMALSPNFLYAMDETAGATTVADLTGQRNSASLYSPGVPPRTLTTGNPVAAGDSGPAPGLNAKSLTGAFLGGAGPVASAVSAPPSYLPPNTAFRVPYIALSTLSNGLPVGFPAVGTAWTRIFAARCSGTYNPDTIGYPLLTTAGTSNGLVVRMDGTVDVGTTLTLSAEFTAQGSTVSVLFPGVNSLALNTGGTAFIDTDWHLYGISISADGKTVSAWCDNCTAPNTATAALPVSLASGFDGDLACYSWSGDFAFLCEIPSAMTAGTWANLYQSWRNAWSTTTTTPEPTSVRYQRILTWLGQVGPSRISSGMCTSVGPATDVAVNPTNPTAGLQALQNVVDTENGQHFIGADGAVVFQSRADRYNKTALITFGEKTALGEVPYLVAELDYDPTRIANDAQVTAQYGTALYRQQDPTSQGKYGAIQLQRTVNSIDPNELTAAAQALLLWNKDPQRRVKTLTVDPSSNPSIWPMVLAAELGLPCQVNRRPQGATQITLPGFIEQISWRLDGKTNQMLFDFQVSANTNRAFRKFDTARFAPDLGSMTLQAGITATATSLTIATAAGKTTMTNTAGSYPFDILIGSEQITLTAAPGGTVSPQTFTVTRGVNAVAHAAGAAVSLAVPVNFAY